MWPHPQIDRFRGHRVIRRFEVQRVAQGHRDFLSKGAVFGNKVVQGYFAVRHRLRFFVKLGIDAVHAGQPGLSFAAQFTRAFACFGVEPVPGEANGLTAKIVGRAQRGGHVRGQPDRAEHAPVTAQFVAADGGDDLFQPGGQGFEQARLHRDAFFSVTDGGAGFVLANGREQHSVGIDRICAQSVDQDQVVQVADTGAAHHQAGPAAQVGGLLGIGERLINVGDGQMGVQPAQAVLDGQRVIQDQALRALLHGFHRAKGQPFQRGLYRFAGVNSQHQ